MPQVTVSAPLPNLLDEHAADVMAVLRGAVGRADAEDCFQETFLAALRPIRNWATPATCAVGC
jgi:DNA-directed RNA polymerase specialized sigma24 family protein